MSYWSNIQASRISWGSEWKNLWIPNYNLLYSKYFINDQVIGRYIKSKFYSDNKLNKTYMYYYDYNIQKIFNQTFIFFKKYNVDFSWLSQAGFLGKLNILFQGLSGLVNNNFYIMSSDAPSFVNFFFQPQSYYFYFLARHMTFDFNILDVNNLKTDSLPLDQTFLLKLFSNSLFLTKLVFSTKTNFFDTDNFEWLNTFFYEFVNYNISNLQDVSIKPKYVYQDKFWLANFLFNPTLLNKYPNFIFFYNNWLHKSWQLSKWWILQSLKLIHYTYNHIRPILTSSDYFFSWYVWFFFFMRELNVFFQGKGAGVGITHEFLAKQVENLLLKIWIWEMMFSKIKEIWFYLKAYLKYFSYEGKVNLNWSWFIFKKLFSFKKLLKFSITGIQFNTPTLFTFLKWFYFSTVGKNLMLSCLNIFFLERNFIKEWYRFLSILFIKTLHILKIILWLRKISIFSKFSLIYSIINKFSLWIFWKSCFFFIVTKKKTTFLPDLNFSSFMLNINALLTLLLFFANFQLSKKQKKKKIIFFIKSTVSHFLPNYKWIIRTKNKQKFLNFYDIFTDVKQNISYCDWLPLILLKPNILLNFLKFSYIWKIERKKKFIYFHFLMANLTPKIFFWIFTDLASLMHFSMLLHLLIIYWQNFFFFYLFVLKCLKRMYSICSRENLLFLSKPIKMFLQRSWTDTTLLDLFSSSFQQFLSLGVYSLEKNITIGDQWTVFSLVDFAFAMSNFGKPNCWKFTTGNMFLYNNKFSFTELTTISPFFIPFISILYSAKTYFLNKRKITNDKKNRLICTSPFFTTWIPTHLIIKHYSNLALSATLIAIFIKKKLEWEHLLAEVLRSLNLLVNQAQTIKGFMFLIKGRFSRKERASKVWFKKGKLEQTMLWTKLDYCKIPVILKYGCASVWVWLLVTNELNDLKAII